MQVFDDCTFHTLETGLVRTTPLEYPPMLSGKVPPEVLKSRVFKHLGFTNPDLILGPAVGQDASLIRIGNRIIVASTDPITGSVEDIGWLSVHVNANDIATFGVEPKWFLASILLPSGSTEHELERIMAQIDDAASSLGITVAGGHTEITEGIDRPIIAGFMIGETTEGDYVTSQGAQPGDAIIMTKSAAIEGTAILAAENASALQHHIEESIITDALALREQISVVKDGVIAFRTGFITAMHDPTEGGIANGIHEICDASNVGCTIVKEHIPIAESTQAICSYLNLDPLQLISSGSMLMTCVAKHAQDVIASLTSHGILASKIGVIEKDFTKRDLQTSDGIVDLVRPETDELWSGLKKINS